MSDCILVDKLRPVTQLRNFDPWLISDGCLTINLKVFLEIQIRVSSQIDIFKVASLPSALQPH